MRIIHSKLFIASVIALVFVLLWVRYVYFDPYRPSNPVYGVSFDPQYATYLGVEPKAAFRAITTDWNFKYVRLPAHWNEVEAEKGKFDFSDLDYYLDEAGKSRVKVIVAVGNKTPRWPECHFPDWIKGLSEEQTRAELLNYIKTTVERYKNNPALETWQVENEPFLGATGGDFGKCVKITPEQLREEVNLVKSLDAKHPVLVADSGELSSWRKASAAADYLGTTLYRVTWNQYIGYWNYDWLPALFYRLKFLLVNRTAANSFVVELQGEPWTPGQNLASLTAAETDKSMSLSRLRKNVDFAARVGVGRVYFWGAEWWYMLKEKGYEDISNFVRGLNPSAVGEEH